MLSLQYSNQNGCHNILHGGSKSYTLMFNYNCIISMSFDDLAVMIYIPIEYNNYTCVNLKEIIYPYFVLDSCENCGLFDLVKFSTCKNRNFLMPFYGMH